MLNRRRLLLRVALYGVGAVAALGLWRYRWPLYHLWRTGSLPETRSVQDVMNRHGNRVRDALSSRLDRWPPTHLRLLAFKQERVVEAWARASDAEPWRHLRTYPVLAASGELGPKRREGDLQVPEGIYGLPVLNPQSRFHLSIRVDYPSAEDIAMSTVPRREMGGDIYVHGADVSVGCLAMGDPAIEELFVLAALVEPERRSIVISPVDFRLGATVEPPTETWLRKRYAAIKTALKETTQERK